MLCFSFIPLDFKNHRILRDAPHSQGAAAAKNVPGNKGVSVFIGI